MTAADAATGCSGKGDAKGNVLVCHVAISSLRGRAGEAYGPPVIDKTLLEGVFEINLQWDRDAPDDPPGTSLLEALPKQLGPPPRSTKGAGRVRCSRFGEPDSDGELIFFCEPTRSVSRNYGREDYCSRHFSLFDLPGSDAAGI